MGKCILVDLTRCTGCRGCQVACKQWKNLPAEKTRNTGTHQNPPDLSDKTIRLVRFTEVKENGKLQWLFFPEQCRHCYSAPCKRAADDFSEGLIMQDGATGAVYPSAKKGDISVKAAKAIRESCPYDIPRSSPDGTGVFKCDFCFDRISNGMKPSCVLTCPTDALVYGDEEEIVDLAVQRLKTIRKEYPKAYLGDPANTRVIYLFQTDHRLYYQDPV
ncbi:MAG: formate dehydrogenase [Desulfovibrionaceae bacterium]|nr:formate dehydrogenase [Desulfovibrionaceae bacterium]